MLRDVQLKLHNICIIPAFKNAPFLENQDTSSILLFVFICFYLWLNIFIFYYPGYGHVRMCVCGGVCMCGGVCVCGGVCMCGGVCSPVSVFYLFTHSQLFVSSNEVRFSRPELNGMCQYSPSVPFWQTVSCTSGH